MTRFFLLLILFSCSNLTLFGQKEKWLSTNLSNGVLIPQFGLLDPIDENPYRSAEINFGFRSSGNNYPHQHFNYPEYGITLFYSNFGANDILGYAFGADYFFKINFIETVHFKLYSRTGFGINYNSKVYDAVENPLNIAKSLHLNFHFSHRWGISYLISNPISLNLGLSFDHFSNANLAYPNHGYNAASVYLGLRHQLRQSPERTTFEPWQKPAPFLLETAFNMGIDHATFPTDRYYAVPTLLFDASYRPGNVFHLGAGSMLVYESSVEDKYGIQDNYTSSEQVSIGVHALQTIHYQRFSFSLYEGYFFKRYEELYRGMYNRVLFGYALNDKMRLNLSLYTHSYEMRYAELGLRFKLVD